MNENTEECIVDYRLIPRTNTADLKKSIERLFKLSKISKCSRFNNNGCITYSYLISQKEGNTNYKINVDEMDLRTKAEMDEQYFKIKHKLKNVRIFKKRIAAAVLIAGVGFTSYNISNIGNGIKYVGDKIVTSLDNWYEESRKLDHIYDSPEEYTDYLKEEHPNMNAAETLDNITIKGK